MYQMVQWLCSLTGKTQYVCQSWPKKIVNRSPQENTLARKNWIETERECGRVIKLNKLVYTQSYIMHWACNATLLSWNATVALNCHSWNATLVMEQASTGEYMLAQQVQDLENPVSCDQLWIIQRRREIWYMVGDPQFLPPPGRVAAMAADSKFPGSGTTSSKMVFHIHTNYCHKAISVYSNWI